MKKLAILLCIALFAGLGAGTAVTYMRVSSETAADSVLLAATADSVRKAAAANEVEEPADTVQADTNAYITPAESLRAVAASRAPLTSATRQLSDASPGDSPSAPANSTKATEKQAPTQTPASETLNAAMAVQAARDAARTTPLPEERLAKIFAQMQARNAARVLEQMEDKDIRSVLALMGDRQAAAILSAFTPERAAAITKGAIKSPGENDERN